MNKLAIGITTFNNADNIENLEKIYNIENIDVYIVDDYSTDATVELLKAKNIDCKFPYKKMGAPGAARNIIIEEALKNGNQFIGFVDGDDDVIIDNLKFLTKKINKKHEMYYTPMLLRGYNEGLVPLGVGNFTYTGKMSKKELIKEKNERLKFQLLLGSGGRIYNLDIIEKYDLKYDENKSGQDGLFNHEYFSHISHVYFNDVSKPFYIYDIQMNSLSNNYDLEVLKKRLILIEEIANYSFAIHTKKEYADKIFLRYSTSNLLAEREKVRLAEILTDFTGEKYSYAVKNDYLKINQSRPQLKSGVNIILIDCQLELPEDERLNVVHLQKIENYESIRKHLTRTKTIVIDRTIMKINIDFILKLIESDEDVIQPKYQTIEGESAQLFDQPIYHGFSNTGFYSTYTYVGMIFSTGRLLQLDFSFINHYEFLVKVLFSTNIIPVTVNTGGFYMRQRKFSGFYKNAIINTFSQCYFANTRAKITRYSKLAITDIVPGTFIGKIPSYKSNNLTFEEHSFVETELLEFQGFQGAYIVNENDEIIEIISEANECNFSNILCCRKVKGNQPALRNKKLINIPALYRIPDQINIKTKSFTITINPKDFSKSSFLSSSYISFEEDVIKKGVNSDYLKLVKESNSELIIAESRVPKGKYLLYFDKTNKDFLYKLNEVSFELDV